MYHKKYLLIVLCAFYAMSCYGNDVDSLTYPLFYVGLNTGYGATTWNGLVPPPKHKNDVVCISAPVEADEGGFLWGFLAGVEFNPFFAVEATYQNYHRAKVKFAETSLFAFEHNDRTAFSTNSDSISLMAKMMLFIPNTCIRIFSSVGIGEIQRDDILFDHRHLGPAFGFGLNVNLDRHWMMEIGGTYTAGYGQAELNPVKDYVPFLYSFGLRIDYRF